MGRFLDRLSTEDPTYRLEETADGFALIRRDGQAEAFNAFARNLIDQATDEFAVFATSDGHLGYERVFLIPA
ncbi:hypothetical protein [Brevundimonas lutea]|uniref:hypothetical protein n=1 Tax=Brevundimonas lutea TaxID=2293980 RepID=UPI000F039FA9|nr:hypothetical protein [Brevundimonas lutea]